MAQIPDKINRTINNYLKVLEENRIPVKEAVLFGSYATGRFKKWSDIDIALVSNFP
jgi:predicted nucleotidyltransferase